MSGLNTEKIHLYRHLAFAFVGGFFGMYGVCGRLLLANAQTLNLIETVWSLLKGDWGMLLVHLGCFVLYFLAAMLAVIIPKKLDIKQYILAGVVDILAAIAMAIIPDKVFPTLALYPIFFAMSLQWSCFNGAEGFASSTIFSTNNTKQTAMSFAEYLCDKDKTHLKKTKFFAKTLLCFHLGVSLAFVAVKFFGTKAILFSIIFILWAMYLGYRETKRPSR